MEKEIETDCTPTPRDLIFSCAICQTTLSQVRERGKIRSSPPTGPHGSVGEALWLAECAHVTCGKHLNDVALATYRAGNNPKAPCPLCSNERNDNRPKTLYAIDGFRDGEYDRDIPKVWFDVPPIELDSSGLAMEALRFQYLSLIRYGTTVGRKAHEDKARIETLMNRLSVSKSDCESLQRENSGLKRHITKLEKLERELMQWRAKEKMIVRHLKAVKNVVKENNHLRLQFSHMGYTVPKTNYFAEIGQTDNITPKPEGNFYGSTERESDRIQVRSVKQAEQDFNLNGKRKYDNAQEQAKDSFKRCKRHSSRDLMPPPSTSDDPLERIDVAPFNDRYACSRRLEETATGFQLSENEIRNSKHDQAKDTSLPLDRARLKEKVNGADLQGLREPIPFEAPNFREIKYRLPIEQYRYTPERQPIRRRHPSSTYYDNQGKNHGLTLTGAHRLPSQSCRTSSEDAMYHIGESRTLGNEAHNYHNESENEVIMQCATKRPYPDLANMNNSLPSPDQGLYDQKLYTEFQGLLPTTKSTKGTVTRFGKATVPSQYYGVRNFDRATSVTSPFFKRRNDPPQTLDFSRTKYLHNRNNNMHSQDRKSSNSSYRHSLHMLHRHSNGLKPKSANNYYRGSINRSQERGQIEKCFGPKTFSERERPFPGLFHRSKANLPFLHNNIASDTSYLSPTRPVDLPNITSATPFATQGLMNTQSVPVTPKPRSHFSSENLGRRRYILSYPNAHRHRATSGIPFEDSWSLTPRLDGKRSLRR